MQEQKEKIIVETKIPFTDAELDRYFENLEDYFFILNYDQSKYKGKKFLNYVYNCDLDCDIIFADMNVDYVEDLLLEFIKSDIVVSIPTLEDIWNYIIYAYVNQNVFLEQDENNVGAKLKAFAANFISKNEKIIEELLSVIASLTASLTKIATKEEDATAELENAEHKNYSLIGKNFISITKNKTFWITAMQAVNNFPVYNYDNFNKFDYDGYNIYHLVMNMDFNPFSMYKTMLMMEEGKEK